MYQEQDQKCNVAPPPKKISLPLEYPVDGNIFASIRKTPGAENPRDYELKLDFEVCPNERMLIRGLEKIGKLPGSVKIHVTGLQDPIRVPGVIISPPKDGRGIEIGVSPSRVESMKAGGTLGLRLPLPTETKKGLLVTASLTWTEGDNDVAALWKSVEIPLDRPEKLKIKQSVPFEPRLIEDREEKFRNICLPKIEK